MLWCQTNLGYRLLTIIQLMQYYVTSVGTKSMESFLVNQLVVHMKWGGAEQPPVAVAASSSVEVFEWSHLLLAVIKHFKDQATRPIAVLEKYEDSGTTEKVLIRHQPKCCQ